MSVRWSPDRGGELNRKTGRREVSEVGAAPQTPFEDRAGDLPQRHSQNFPPSRPPVNPKPRLRAASLIAALLLACATTTKASAEPTEEARAEPDRRVREARNTSERPLTLPEDLFAVYGSAGGGQLTPDIA